MDGLKPVLHLPEIDASCRTGFSPSRALDHRNAHVVLRRPPAREQVPLGHDGVDDRPRRRRRAPSHDRVDVAVAEFVLVRIARLGQAIRVEQQALAGSERAVCGRHDICAFTPRGYEPAPMRSTILPSVPIFTIWGWPATVAAKLPSPSN